MKILHIGKYYPPFHGGIENFMCSLMEQQKSDGHIVSAIVHHHTKKKPFIEEIVNGYNIYRVPFYGQFSYAPISPSFGFYLNNVFKKERPDLIHIHTPNLSAFWCLLSPLIRKTPWIIQWQSDVVGEVPNIKIKILYPLFSFFEKALLNKAKKIIVATPPYAQTSKPLEKFGQKIVIVPLALSEIILAETPKLKASPTINLLMIGRLTYYKGHKIIIEALARLKEQKVNFCLKIIGHGELFSELEEQIKDLNLDSNVKLLGKVSDDDLISQLNHTDLLCLPSIERTEAFGVVLLEAMRASKACLVTDVIGSGMSWVVQDGKTGVVVKNNDASSLVEKLKFIALNRELLPIYGEAGRKRFDKVFSIQSVSSEISKIYLKVLENNNIP